MLGIIAGTGFYDWEGLKNQQERTIATPYGDAVVFTSDVFVGDKNSGDTGEGKKQVVFLPRHARNHSIPPHKINYRANIWALHSLGVDHIVAINAVGSLLRDVPPGSIVLVDDFMDFTHGREDTFFTGGEAGLVHTDMTDCYDSGWQQVIREAAARAGIELIDGGVYVCVQGPRFESRAEIRFYAMSGGTVTGMTGVPEVVLANELGIKYGSLAMVTNFACGLTDKVSNDEVQEVMSANTSKLARILLEVVRVY